ncbi:MAG: ABC transporter substrate-binding protein [Acidimicrobiaceae bacterium]|nr:ABC transporter substrate-binding protein [Acidimicrobiaceae bacterium]MCY3644672.1 ABC transporter substrate-binding protein [Acidimicrobiaceae bacterium]MDE0494562.1 ABC transporter substrate-binding protein [Acidimicrobiaceae bacterium]MDE0667228.1 ABC transporter substrate-binding protein [Acidimicrobiaceae bacterium]MXW88297.1 ABC transporter substrate-binding protein [Acidimicrobiaceae bacterium]
MSRPLRLPTAGIRLALAASLLLAACASEDAIEEGPGPSTAAAPTAPGASQESMVGLSDDRILFGQSAAFSGPAQELGKNMQLGILAAFDEVNRQGGVHGRVLELQSLDDAYEPEDAIVMTRHLIEQEQVFALIGAVGTPTSRSATPIARDSGVPYIAPFTGAAFLRDDEWDNIINLRASYNQETEEMVARLTDDLGITRVGVMYQNDSFGRAGFRGAVAALARRDMEPVSIGIYPRNTTAVKTALLDLRLGEPEAVIMIGAYEPVARLISWARRTDMDPVFMTVSFVGSNALAQELGPDGAGVLVTQVVPFPEDDSLPVVHAYLEALAAHDPAAEPGFVSLEGYLAGRMVISALQECGADVQRSCLLDQLIDRGSYDIDGFELQFGEGDNQGSDEVFLTVIGSDGEYHPVHTLHETAIWVIE